MILTWSCDICKMIRNDEDITVISYPLEGLDGAVRNLRYCVDNTECFAGARARADTGKM